MSKKMNFQPEEKKLIGGISLVLATRMLGVSLVIPMFSIFATSIPDSTTTLAGVAVGIFGIAQTIMQVPMGRLSDSWGRKQTTVLGLIIYLAGTVFSGMASSIYHLIVARIIAGAGAVSGVTMAWLTDGIHRSRRNTALSYVGISIGSSVIVGFTLSSFIADIISIPALFYICGGFIFISVLYIVTRMDNRVVPDDDTDISIHSFKTIIGNRDLRRLSITGFIAFFALNGMFFTMPLIMHEQLGVGGLWKVFLPVAIVGTGCMFYYGRKADSAGTVKIAMTALVYELIGILIIIMGDAVYLYILGFMLFYAGHCILSPVLPAAVSRYPSDSSRGSVMGVFNSSQFIGASTGGFFSGVMLDHFDYRILFIALFLLLLFAIIAILRYKNFTLHGPLLDEKGQSLESLHGGR